MIILWFSFGSGFFAVYDSDTVLVAISNGYAGKHGSESSSAASPKTISKT